MDFAISDRSFFQYPAVYFAIVLGALIVVHEFGHFIVAKKSGVRVERFSIGFGPPLWRKLWRGTEYRLALVPLGGYVKMYGEQLDETLGDPRGSFLHQSVWRAYSHRGSRSWFQSAFCYCAHCVYPYDWCAGGEVCTLGQDPGRVCRSAGWLADR